MFYFLKQKLQVFWVVMVGLSLGTLNSTTLTGAQNLIPVSIAPAQNQGFTIFEDQKLMPDDVPPEGFGYSNALYGDTALVGSFDYAGGAYIFVRSSGIWTQQAKLTVNNTHTLGKTVALYGDTALVSAYGTYPDTATAVYVFVRNGSAWTQQAKLTESDNQYYFGESLALYGDTALIGNPYANNAKGAVYVFVRSGSTWTQQAVLTRSDGEIHTVFGSFIAFEGDTAIMGASHAAYVFVRSGTIWTQQAKLSIDDADFFGAPVALSGDTALIQSEVNNRPVVEVFVRNGSIWVHQARLSGGDDIAGFGSPFALDGDIALLTAQPFPPDYTGKVYVYVRSGGIWTERVRLAARNPEDETFGSFSVALNGDTALVNGGYVFNHITREITEAQLLVNGSFEIDSDNNYVPDSWRRKNPVGDGIRCNKPEQPPVAYEGQCAYLFKDDPTGTNILAQNVDLTRFDLNTGDQIKLTGFYNKQSAGKVYAWVYVSYTSLPEENVKVAMTKPTNGYQPIYPIALTLKAKPTRVRVVIQNAATSGKTWFDAMSLKWTPANSINSEIIPLPLAPLSVQ